MPIKILTAPGDTAGKNILKSGTNYNTVHDASAGTNAGNTDNKVDDSRIIYVGNRSQNELYSIYKSSKYFLHLAWLDHCPNVVCDARGCGCQIICSSSGGTQEIAGDDAIIIEEDWNNMVSS